MFVLNSAWQRFLSTDVRPDMPPSQKNKIYITRGASLFLALLGPVFMVINLVQGNFPLASVNLVSTTLGLTCLLLVRCKIFRTAAALLVVGSCVVFAFSGLIFHNGMEYTLLLGMLGAVFMFESFPARHLLVILNGAVFLGIQVQHFDSSIPDQVSQARYATNLLVFLLSYYWILEIIRTINGNHRRDIERKNADLIQSRHQLDEEHTQLIARTDDLHTANQAKEKLLSIVAHDLRGPVGNLRTSMTLLSDRDLSPSEFQGMIGDLKKDVDHAYECLDTLLVWSASQLRAIKPILAEVSLQSVARECVALLSPTATHKDIAIQNTIPAEARVWADETQTASIFRNLLSNALKFTPAGGTVKISAAEKNGFWQVTIADSGVGMTAEKVRQLLEPSHVSSTTGTDNERGFGLGLQICHDFIRNNQGSLAIESREDHGSSFHFTLPSFANQQGLKDQPAAR